jgi:exopolysaccharide/PEP-CTERM locus tyrosine autokinase
MKGPDKMNKHTPIKPPASLLERANELYDFGAALRGGAPAPAPIVDEQTVETAPVKPVAPAVAPAAVMVSPTPAPRSPTRGTKPVAKVDRERLLSLNFIDPYGSVTGLSEEFRIVKRQLLLAARGGKGVDAIPHGERILICSANPNEGKTFCAVNLALSMASEKDNRVLLVDADFAKPSVLARLGIEGGRGLMDALADPAIDVEDLVIETDIEGLSILPAGAQTNQDTEYLAASRTAAVLDQLTRHDPSRIIIFDSPPALAASPASVLALHVGQAVMVVHADVTTDSALRDALSLLSGCEHIQLLLNRAKFSPTGRKFGNYYGYGA